MFYVVQELNFGLFYGRIFTGDFMNKKIKFFIAIFLVIALAIGGGYLGNMFGVFSSGNYSYGVKTVPVVSDSPLKNKTIIFLGSSVTDGYGSLGVSFVDFLEKSDGITAVKEAVSNTMLVDIKNNSYVSRMKTIDKNIKADAFVCQLSTNDAKNKIPLGNVSYSFNIEDFDTQTIAGAIEYIIAYAKDIWGCPVVFYTQARYDNEHYGKMVDLLLEIQEKWDITVIDFWNDDEINKITDEERKMHLVDHIHPTRAGYRDWWLPKFQECLYETVE